MQPTPDSNPTYPVSTASTAPAAVPTAKVFSTEYLVAGLSNVIGIYTIKRLDLRRLQNKAIHDHDDAAAAAARHDIEILDAQCDAVMTVAECWGIWNELQASTVIRHVDVVSFAVNSK